MPDPSDPQRSGTPIQRHHLRQRPFRFAAGDSQTIQRVADHITRHIGPIAWQFHEIASDAVHIDIHIVAPTEQRPFYTLITSGMGERPMATPINATAYRHGELMMCLPRDWPLDEGKLRPDSPHFWPLRWLSAIARFPHTQNTWLCIGHSIPNGEPAEPLDSSVPFCGLFLAKPRHAPDAFLRLPISAEKTILFYALIPVFKDEMDYKVKHGAEELSKRFEEAGVTELLNSQRSSAIHPQQEELVPYPDLQKEPPAAGPALQKTPPGARMPRSAPPAAPNPPPPTLRREPVSTPDPPPPPPSRPTLPPRQPSRPEFSRPPLKRPQASEEVKEQMRRRQSNWDKLIEEIEQELPSAPDEKKSPADAPAASPLRLKRARPRKRRSRQALASVILGSLGFLTCGVSSIAGLWLGILAQKNIRKSHGVLKGMGLAMTGISVSIVSILFIIPLFTGVFMPALHRYHENTERTQCLEHLGHLTTATLEYARQNRGHLPAATNWCGVIEGKVRSANLFQCPKETTARGTYGFNAQLGGLRLIEIDSNTVLLFEVEGGWNVNGGLEHLPFRPRHVIRGKRQEPDVWVYSVSFVDGRTELIDVNDLDRLRWKP